MYKRTRRGALILNAISFVAGIVSVAMLLDYQPVTIVDHLLRAWIIIYSGYATMKAYNCDLHRSN